MLQDGKSAEFEICTDDASYHEKMAGVYPSMVFTASLWGKIYYFIIESYSRQKIYISDTDWFGELNESVNQI